MNVPLLLATMFFKSSTERSLLVSIRKAMHTWIQFNWIKFKWMKLNGITYVGHAELARIGRVQSAEGISQFPVRFSPIKSGQLSWVSCNQVLRQFIADRVVRILDWIDAVLQPKFLHADFLPQYLNQFNSIIIKIVSNLIQ